MSKDDSDPGLLSKMVKFVRNPATSWSELDSIQTDKEDSVSKKLLKEMVGRKQKNDFVRKREFDMLRKLRRQESATGPNPERAGTPSFFQSSIVSRTDDRASTLKKIDDIEAQMSMQWWKTKNPANLDHFASLRTPPLKNDLATLNPLIENALPLAYRTPVSADLSIRIPEGAAPVKNDVNNRAQTVPASSSALDSVSGFKRSQNSHASMYSSLRSNSGGVQQMALHDTELEDAAIHFANGDDASAEAGLLQILAPGAVRENHMESWLTLFDLYRATGELNKFETAAIEFMTRFDRSPPQWSSMPEVVKAMGRSVQRATKGPADWICPSVMGVQTVATLRAAMGRAAMPWRLDWSNLKTIKMPALEPLLKVFSQWARDSVQLRFMGEAQLQTVLRQATPPGDQSTDQSWWLLRLETLRVTHRPDEFELTALDFCVTYEVSPPAWENSRCNYKSLDEQGDLVASATTLIGSASEDAIHSEFNSQTLASALAGTAPQNQHLIIELWGEILSDAVTVLDEIESKLASKRAEAIHISCAKLIRIDFSAAGTLLNWVSLRQGENRLVQFSDVNRLVASFFHVIGITEHAQVLVRSD